MYKYDPLRHCELGGFFDTVKDFFSSKSPQTIPSKSGSLPVPWYQQLVSIYGAVQGQRQADKLQKENLERMRQGLPVLNVQQWADSQPPAATIRHEVDSGTKQLLLYGGLGLGAILLFTILKKK